MEAPKRPVARMTSMCAPETARATLAFEIAGHSLYKGFGSGNFIRSASFAVGWYDWCIRYYPEGSKNNDYIKVSLEFLTKCGAVKALYDFRLVNRDAGLSSPVFSCSAPRLFTSETKPWGFSEFMKCSDLEKSGYLSDDRLVIECDLTVIKEPLVADIVKTLEVKVPPSDLSDNLGKLLETREEANVNFKVKGVVFPAHKIILAMRSPVFKAELYGPMRDARSRDISIEDMEPAIFKALLHFIYTDSLPSMDDLDAVDNEEMVKHLLVAADRYAMERMKLICESILCKSLKAENVAATLVLADQHHCSKLKDASIEFINSLTRMDDVVASPGYEHLKRACPAVFVDIWERAVKTRRN